MQLNSGYLTEPPQDMFTIIIMITPITTMIFGALPTAPLPSMTVWTLCEVRTTTP